MSVRMFMPTSTHTSSHMLVHMATHVSTHVSMKIKDSLRGKIETFCRMDESAEQTILLRALRQFSPEEMQGDWRSKMATSCSVVDSDMAMLQSIAVTRNSIGLILLENFDDVLPGFGSVSMASMINKAGTIIRPTAASLKTAMCEFWQEAHMPIRSPIRMPVHMPIQCLCTCPNAGMNSVRIWTWTCR